VVFGGVEHESDIHFVISYHLGKILPTFTKKKGRGDQEHFRQNFLYGQYIAQSTQISELNLMAPFLLNNIAIGSS
jgi:hypothetical protein